MAVGRQTRQLVAERARRCCEYCRSQEAFSPDRFQIDHVIPGSKGGTDDAGNLAWSCGGCNNAKSDHLRAVDPESGASSPLFNPRADVWMEHFRWSDDRLRIEGVSPVGKATVVALSLNRPNLIRLREVLRDAAAHPPDY